MEQASLGTPFLQGKTIFLRGLTTADLTGRYFTWFNDQEVCRFNSHGRFPNSAEKMDAYYRHVTQSKNDLVLAIVDAATTAHVGNIALQSINWVDRTAEYAIVIGEKQAWGRGVGKEASDLVIKHGFEVLNLHRIYCGTSEDNDGMKKLAAHMGMKEEGRRREAIFKNGRYRDVLEYGILRSEYERAPD
jgi:[ribosomal protein S5]-alanine N-acetyltransferase